MKVKRPKRIGTCRTLQVKRKPLKNGGLPGLGDGEGLGVGVGVGDMSGEGEVSGVGEGDAAGVGEGVVSGVGLGLVSGVGLGLASGVGLGSTVGDGLTTGEGDASGVGDGDGSGVGEGERAGSTADWEFWGCGTVLPTKSVLLLSVSSPFPANSSLPPEPILVSSEVELAFLSALVLASGAAKDVPSPKGFAGAPKVTASTSTPSFKVPLTTATLLLFETVALVLALHPRAELKSELHHK